VCSSALSGALSDARGAAGACSTSGARGVAGAGALSARGSPGAPALAAAGAGSGARAAGWLSRSGDNAGNGGGTGRPALDTTALDGTGDSRCAGGKGVGRLALAASTAEV
jgi:hypothetical protein